MTPSYVLHVKETVKDSEEQLSHFRLTIRVLKPEVQNFKHK